DEPAPDAPVPGPLRIGDRLALRGPPQQPRRGHAEEQREGQRPGQREDRDEPVPALVLTVEPELLQEGRGRGIGLGTALHAPAAAVQQAIEVESAIGRGHR
ncbi:MAG: hypothetical protein ACK56F_22875, partial [bacterium]